MVTISAIWPMLMTGMTQLAGMPTCVFQECAGPVEVALVNGRIDEGDDEQHEHEGHARSSFMASSQAKRSRRLGRGPSAACAASAG